MVYLSSRSRYARARRRRSSTSPPRIIPIPTNFAGVSIDLEAGATSNEKEGFAAGDANFFFGGAGIGNTDPAANLVVNVDTVESGSTFSTGYGSSGDISTHFAPFTSGTPGYIGFSLEITEPTTVYGWMRVTLQDDNTPGVIHE